MALTDQELVRREKLTRLRELGINPYPEKYEVTLHLRGSSQASRWGGRRPGSWPHPQYPPLWQANLIRVSDLLGDLQLALRQDVVGEEVYSVFHSTIDIGDFIGAKGEMFTTRTGEKTLRIDEYTFLGKAPAASTGEVARPDRCRSPLSPALP